MIPEQCPYGYFTEGNKYRCGLIDNISEPCEIKEYGRCDFYIRAERTAINLDDLNLELGQQA